MEVSRIKTDLEAGVGFQQSQLQRVAHRCGHDHGTSGVELRRQRVGDLLHLAVEAQFKSGARSPANGECNRQKKACRRRDLLRPAPGSADSERAYSRQDE